MFPMCCPLCLSLVSLLIYLCLICLFLFVTSLSSLSLSRVSPLSPLCQPISPPHLHIFVIPKPLCISPLHPSFASPCPMSVIPFLPLCLPVVPFLSFLPLILIFAIPLSPLCLSLSLLFLLFVSSFPPVCQPL